ncbi:MAG: Ig-like domain-containing protein [Gemmatimonadota bacterium]|nr:Ig-like domain-containing protein [Gemmatimonadota bacterium]
MKRSIQWSAVVTAAAVLAACSGSSASPTAPGNHPVAAQVVSVSPAGGATGVSANSAVVVTFSQPMHASAATYMSLHQGTVAGAVVPAHGMWSPDSTQFTFSPDSMMAAHSTYAFHMGGGFTDAKGDSLDLSRCAQFGGQAVTSQMMSGGMMGGSEMGSGWQTPGTNTYGMMFSFTTR